MDDERQKKIQAGKLKLAEFKKRRNKSSKFSSVSESSVSSIDEKSVPDDPGGEINQDVTSESSLCMNEDCVVLSLHQTSMDNIPIDSLSQLSEGSDDLVPFINAEEAEIVALYDQKIRKYQDAIQQRDNLIQELTSRLESAMFNLAASSAGSMEVENLKHEINMLHLQMKEATEMLEKQKTKAENPELNFGGNAGPEDTDVKVEAGIQVDAKEISAFMYNDETSAFENFISSYCATHDSSGNIANNLSSILKKNIPQSKIQELILCLKQNLESCEDIENITDLSFNSRGEHKKYASVDKSDTHTVLKKIASLNVVAKLIEALLSTSSNNISDCAADFSPSKFQSFFLKRLNSGDDDDDAVPDASENESQVSDINYAEVEVQGDKSFTENPLFLLSAEKLRSRNVMEDFTFVTEFLCDEMEKIGNSFSVTSMGPHGDSPVKFYEAPCSRPGIQSPTNELIENCEDDADIHKIMFHKSKLESRLKHFRQLEKELQHVEQNTRQRSVESDTLTTSEDNLLMEEPPLSCVSLLSLTDSEYRTEYVTTDSETNFSRKVSIDMTRSMQEKELCIKCEKYVEQLKEKSDNDIVALKQSLENFYNNQKTEYLETIKRLDSENLKLKLEKDDVLKRTNEQIELLCNESEMKFQQISEKHNEDLSKLKVSKNEYEVHVKDLGLKLKDLEEKLSQSNKKILELLDDKARIEYTLQNQIADLIQEHQEDLQNLKSNAEKQFTEEKKRLENEYLTSFSVMKKLHEDDIDDIKCQIKKEFEEREKNLINEHSQAVSVMEAAHCDESATYQKRIEQLLEEKCELLSKTTQEYETILKKNHKVLVILCKELRSKINFEKQKLGNETLKSGNSDFETSFTDALDELNKSVENGIVRFLNQNYFMNNGCDDIYFDETEYMSFEAKLPVSEDDLPLKKGNAHVSEKEKIKETNYKDDSCQKTHQISSEDFLDPEDIHMIHSEINKLQEEFQRDVSMYKEVNEKLHEELKILRKQYQESEEQKQNLAMQLNEKERELAAKDCELASIDVVAAKGGISGLQLSATDISSWQVHAAQTNSRLLHVLSDLVKTFLDIEQDINSHLREHGLIPAHSGSFTQQDDETGQSVGSREDFASLSLGECPNLELTEDGPDLTPRAWDVFASVGTYDTDIEGEDVVLGASRRLRMAVEHVLNLLTRALDNQQNQDLKLLLKRNEELSQELQEESQGRDEMHIELVTAESNIRKIEAERQRFEDLNQELKENQDLLKRELSIERNKIAHIEQEKETAYDQIHTLKEQCELLASRLGDPEKIGNDKMLSSSDTSMHEKTELLQENSRLSSEKQNVQKNLNKERQSFLDRLHQMEIALDELKSEKDDIIEGKCKEIRDLKAEMEAMEKQLQSNKKFIEEQALEREQEREDFIKEINKMQDFVREKEKIQSNEAQLTKEIDALEQLLRARIEDHKNAMSKKDEVEKELRQSVDKIRDLRDVIEELEKQLDIKCRVESELRQKLSSVCESLSSMEKNHSSSEDGASESKSVHMTGESIEQLHNLKEQIVSQSQELQKMSQSQTLLHELRGQIHFLEAKVDQRAQQLEAMFFSSSPIQSGDTSPSGSQDSESLHIPCEDGWEMSPRSIHWLEIRRLEEKFGRLAHIDEELIKKNKELEQQLRKIKLSYSECQNESSALQEKLSEQLIQISALKSHIEEQKHRCATPQKTNSTEKIEELQEAFEEQLERNKRLESEFEDVQCTVGALKEEIHRKDNVIAILQKKSQFSKKQMASGDEAYAAKDFSTTPFMYSKEDPTTCVNLMLLEKNEHIDNLTHELECLQRELEHLRKDDNAVLLSTIERLRKELENKVQIVDEVQQENSELKSQTELLNQEISSLRELLEKAEKEVESEKAQVETLCEEMANLAQNSKRLEQDFNTIQDMMQQKERELETLHEETEAQMKLEAEVDSLEKLLEEQKTLECCLREKIEELEETVESFKNIIENKDEEGSSYIKELEKAYLAEIGNLQKQIEALKKYIAFDDNEDLDYAEITTEIMEAAKVFKVNGEENQAFKDVIHVLLKKAVDRKLKEMQKKHESHVNEINKSWQQKVNGELSSKNNEFQLQSERLQKKLKKENEKSCAEKDAYWQKKLKDLEMALIDERSKSEKAFKDLEKKLQESYAEKNNALKNNIECVLAEKAELESRIKYLNCEVENSKQTEINKRIMLMKDYEEKLSDIKEKFSKEIQQVENSHKCKVEELHRELSIKLEAEKNMEIKHKEELYSLHKYFQKRWADEMKKIQTFQSEELKKLKFSKEKDIEAFCHNFFKRYGDNFKKAQEEWALQIAEEKMQNAAHHKHELQQLQLSLEAKFEKEMQKIFELKESELKAIKEDLEKNFHSKLSEKKNLTRATENTHSDENQTKKWEGEKLKLISSHQNEMLTLKRELQAKYEKQLKSQLMARDAEMKCIEEAYNKKVEEAHELLREAKCIASRSDSGSNRTTTPSSDMTSSDEACSSCQEDMLARNKHILVNKIHQDGKRVLSLIESTQNQFPYDTESHRWLEERKWIVNKLKTFTFKLIDDQISLKQVISDIVDELQKTRRNLGHNKEEIAELKDKCMQLEHELKVQHSTLYDQGQHLSHQKSINQELESLLAAKTSELNELRKLHSQEYRLLLTNSSSKNTLTSNGSTASPYEIGCLRSADDPRSAEKFSMFLPEIGDSEFLLHKNLEDKILPQFPEEVEVFPEKLESVSSCNSLSYSIKQAENESVSSKHKHFEITNSQATDAPINAKLHGLYLVYKRSQSYNKALIYQKKYLLMLLKGFLATEKVTLAWLNHMGAYNSSASEANTSSCESSLHGRSLFRSAAFVIIAIQRMKFSIRRWQLLARIPSNQVINIEVKSVFQAHPLPTPTLTQGGCYSSSYSLASISTSIGENCERLRSSETSSFSRLENKRQKFSTPDKSQLVEYLHRLENLHKQLGLDNSR